MRGWLSYPTGTLQPMEVKRIKYFDKIVPSRIPSFSTMISL